MDHVKNYKTVSKLVKVVQRKVQTLFSGHGVHNSYYLFRCYLGNI